MTDFASHDHPVARPLTAREIEHALRAHGVPKRRAAMHANALRKLSIVAITGDQDDVFEVRDDD